MSCNILLTCVGRRVELVSFFKKTAQEMNISSNIIVADASKLSPALYYGDKYYILPKLEEESYLDELKAICTKENITYVIPTIDTELLLLSKNKQNIKAETGAEVIISDEAVIRICRDKIKTHTFLRQNGFNTPQLYTMDDNFGHKNINFPLFIKPLDGSSSINAFRVDTLEDLVYYKNKIKDCMIQEFIDGDEYTVDIFTDFNSKVISIVPRLRIATRGGEILKGKTVKDKDIIESVKLLVSKLKPIGHITVQLIKSEDRIYYIEINPRFGGGAPMSFISGCNSCEYIYRLHNNEKLEYDQNFKENMIFLRYDNCININGVDLLN